MPRHRYKKPLLGLILAASLTLAACGGDDGAESASTEGKTKIGVSFDKLEDFRRGERKALEEAAKELGAELRLVNAQEDAQRQSQQIQTLLSQGVKAIIAIPWDIEAVASDIQTAKSANVPFVTMNQAPADVKSATYHVGGDPCADGRAAGEFFAKPAKGKPAKLLEIQGSLSNDNGIRRSRCLEEG